MGTIIPRSTLVDDLLAGNWATEIQILFPATNNCIESKFQWQIYHGPESNMESLYPQKFSIFLRNDKLLYEMTLSYLSNSQAT